MPSISPGGTAVEGGEADGVADARGKRQIAIPRQFAGQPGAQFVDHGRGVLHGRDPASARAAERMPSRL